MDFPEELSSSSKEYSPEVTDYVRELVSIANTHDASFLKKLNPSELMKLTPV